MKITFLSVGSRGDVQPTIALGVALKKYGYAVQIVTFEDYRSLVEMYGVDFSPLSAGLRKLMDIKDIGFTNAGTAVFRLVPELLKLFRQVFAQMTQEFWQACQGCDLLVSNAATAMLAGPVAEKLSIAHIETSVFPGWPTRSFASIFWPWPTRVELQPRGPAGQLRGAFNLMTYLPMRWAVALGLQPVVERCRREILRLPAKGPARNAGDPASSAAPYLAGFSELVIPRPADWAEHIHITGYWFVDTPAYQPPPGLQAFLAAGAPPVYVGFGSMPSQDPGQVTSMITQALELSGQRGILFTGQESVNYGMLPQQSGSRVYFTESIPHDWLFPRMAAVVHHGGSGTTAAGIRAGVPSIVLPIAGDQLLWARRVLDLGVGSRPIPRKSLTAERLAQAIRQVTTDPVICQRAASLGEKLRTEDGAERAAAIIHQYLKD